MVTIGAGSPSVRINTGKLHGIFLAMLCATLAACVPYQPKPVDLSDAAVKFQARRLDDPALSERIAGLLPGSVPTGANYDRAQLLAAALILNPELAATRAEVQIAVAHEITAGEAPNPDLTLQSEYARHDPHPWLYGLGLDVLLRMPAQKRIEVDAAKLEISNARWTLSERGWQVRHELTTALSDRESASRRLAVLDRLADAQIRLYDFEQRRVAAGEDAPDALLVSGQARIEVEQQQVQARADLAAADAAVAKAIGLPPEALRDVRIDWSDWGSPPPSDASLIAASREQALRSRADLASAVGAYAIAENKLHQAVMRQYPQLHFLPGYYWDHGISKYPIDVSFGLPFNRNRGEIAEAMAQREVEGQRMLGVQSAIFHEIGAAEAAERVARDGNSAAARSLESTREQQRRIETGVRLGAGSMGDRVAADVLTLRAELEGVQMQTQLQSARNALEDALHAPLSGPELAFAKPLPIDIAGASP